jgi:CMP/dCMP kinase
MIISISGALGSGKTSVGKLLAKKLGLSYYSMGDIMGSMAQERGITLEEFGKVCETDRNMDKEIDAHQIRMGKEIDNFVMDSRLAFHFIPQSIKVCLTADEDVRVQRTWNDKTNNRTDEKQHNSPEEKKEAMRERRISEKIRYKKFYDLDDFTDPKHYDIIIDTTNISIEEVVQKIIDFINNKK